MRLLEYLEQKEGIKFPVSSISFGGSARSFQPKCIKNKSKQFALWIDFYRYFVEGDIVYSKEGYTIYKLKNVRRNPFLIHGDIDLSSTKAMRETLSECDITNTVEEAIFLVKEMIRDDKD